MISTGVRKDYLWRSRSSATGPPSPPTAAGGAPPAGRISSTKGVSAMRNSHRLRFSKLGRAKYISHLDLMSTFQRAFLRAGIEIKHTEGFTPTPLSPFRCPCP